MRIESFSDYRNNKNVDSVSRTLKINKFKMAAIEQRLTAALEQIAAISARNQHNRQPHKEIQYIPEFSGEHQKLTHFISMVDTHLETTAEDQRALIWRTIYNVKITGRAKELLLNNTVTSWETARILLTQHFRPQFNVKDITRKINNLKVGSISELNVRIEQLIGDINALVLYETDRDNLKNMLYNSLTLKIKDLVTGSLSRELRNVYDIHRVKEILYTYIGFDENLENKYHSNPHKSNPLKQKPNPPHHYPSDNSGKHKNFNQRQDQFRNYGNQNNSNRIRNNYSHTFNPSGQFRNAAQNPQPMEIDQINEVEETNNNIEQQFFLN